MPRRRRGRRRGSRKSHRIRSREEEYGADANHYEYDSVRGYSPHVWGTAMWLFLGIIGRNYKVYPTNVDRTHYYTFVTSLKHVLPCGECRENLKMHLRDLGFTGYRCKHLKNREAFSAFINTLHNTVNEMLSKPTWDFATHRDYFENLRASCDDEMHHGCDVAVKHTVKSKCLLTIVPRDQVFADGHSIELDKRCIAT